MLQICKCPSCGSKQIKRVRRDWTDEYKGKSYTVPDLGYYDCPKCGEKVYDPAAMRKIEAFSPAFTHRRARKKLVR